MMEGWQHGGFGLYLHWPFCQSKCPYCDFNSHVAAEVDEARWARAFQHEIARNGALTPGRYVQSIYFGGGTPSLMSPDLVDGILTKIRETWAIANDCEITLEANPGSIESGRFRGYRDAGVNRISMGMQAMNDADLRRLGRMHTAAEARQAYEISRKIFERVSFDLIYARQQQTLEQWKTELRDAVALATGHLSLYQLTIEDGTVFGERFARGQLRGLPTEGLSVSMYHATEDICASAGMPSYEVSNYACAGQESRHNLLYWRGGDYVGVGPGAHGRLTIANQRCATVGALAPAAWLSRVESIGSGDISCEALSAAETVEEYVMMGLRLTAGVSLARILALGGKLDNDSVLRLVDLGKLEVNDDVMRVTAEGRLVLNAVLRQLLA